VCERISIIAKHQMHVQTMGTPPHAAGVRDHGHVRLGLGRRPDRAYAVSIV
jgi:hypothetical protein